MKKGFGITCLCLSLAFIARSAMIYFGRSDAWSTFVAILLLFGIGEILDRKA